MNKIWVLSFLYTSLFIVALCLHSLSRLTATSSQTQLPSYCVPKSSICQLEIPKVQPHHHHSSQQSSTIHITRILIDLQQLRRRNRCNIFASKYHVFCNVIINCIVDNLDFIFHIQFGHYNSANCNREGSSKTFIYNVETRIDELLWIKVQVKSKIQTLKLTWFLHLIQIWCG